MRSTQYKRTNWLAVNVEDSYFQTESTIQHFLEFATDLFVWGDVLYGYASHEIEFEQTNKLPRPTLINNKLIATGGMKLQDCLPGVYWANFFGNTYADWLGRERFFSLLAHKQRELPNSGILLLTSWSPLTYSDTGPNKLAIRKNLGEDVFFDLRNPTRTCRSPFKDGTIAF